MSTTIMCVLFRAADNFYLKYSEPLQVRIVALQIFNEESVTFVLMCGGIQGQFVG